MSSRSSHTGSFREPETRSNARLKTKLQFFRNFLRNPAQVGAVLPSGKRLAAEITRPIDFAAADAIAELGPGTGAFTEFLLKQMREETKLVAFEINPAMADGVQKRFPSLDLVRDGAENMRQHLDERGIKKVDAIVSGLPFAMFPEKLQGRILDAAHESLAEEGVFLTFLYWHSMTLPTTARFFARLKKHFPRVDRVPVVRNIPPAFVVRARK